VSAATRNSSVKTVTVPTGLIIQQEEIARGYSGDSKIQYRQTVYILFIIEITGSL
jgi:hypothetical protein